MKILIKLIIPKKLQILTITVQYKLNNHKGEEKVQKREKWNLIWHKVRVRTYKIDKKLANNNTKKVKAM